MLEIKDLKNGLICTSLNGGSSDAEIENLRTIVKDEYSKSGYVGFSDKFDKQFDNSSTYLYVTKGPSDIQAVQRVTRKTNGNKMPLELARIYCTDVGKKYSIDEDGVAEITSSVFKSTGSMELLFTSIAHFGKINRIKKAFALLDVKSEVLKELYKKTGWEESTKYNEPVYFADYGKMLDGKFTPTVWKIMEMNEERILKLAEKVNKYQIVEE